MGVENQDDDESPSKCSHVAVAGYTSTNGPSYFTAALPVADKQTMAAVENRQAAEATCQAAVEHRLAAEAKAREAEANCRAACILLELAKLEQLKQSMVEPPEVSQETVLATLDRLSGEDDNATQAKLAHFRALGKTHIDVKPIYLGFTEWKNFRGPISSAQMKHLVVARFQLLSAAEYGHHPLKEFFEPSPSGSGYMPKMVTVRAGQTHIMFDVDHVVPKRWGGIDHPRNYVLMHQSMNRSFGDNQPEVKMAYYGSQNRTVLRKVAEFTRKLFECTSVGAAITSYLLTGMDDW